MHIITDTAQTEQVQDRAKFLRAMEKIEGIRNKKERWHAIRNLMWHINPETFQLDRLHCATVEETRQAQLYTHGGSKKLEMRSLYSMPEYLYRALQTMDPEFQATQACGDAQTVKRYNQSIWKAFPEYRVAQEL